MLVMLVMMVMMVDDDDDGDDGDGDDDADVGDDGGDGCWFKYNYCMWGGPSQLTKWESKVSYCRMELTCLIDKVYFVVVENCDLLKRRC